MVSCVLVFVVCCFVLNGLCSCLVQLVCSVLSDVDVCCRLLSFMARCVWLCVSCCLLL